MRGDLFFAQMSKRPPFTKLHPQLAGFLKDYLAHEKVVQFGEQHVVNTHFPPYPSRAFEQLVDGFSAVGDAEHKRLYSVTLAVTNRCDFNCWHCYNSGRSQDDISLDALKQLAVDIQDRGAVMVTLTGGEPLLRDDLEEIVAAFDDRSCLILGTTGDQLSRERARRLKHAGLFALAVSLDSVEPLEHDRMRGRDGAFNTAIEGIGVARDEGLYPYVVAVATREFLVEEHFFSFMRFVGEAGALEVHLLEPSATGRLADRKDVLLSADERERILQYQQQVAEDSTLPILSSYTYLEGPTAFGCGAGLTHLYVDGSGEVCPCQLAPVSFGNVTKQPLLEILERMGQHFQQPRARCVGRVLGPGIPAGALPTELPISEEVCERCLPTEHAVPRFFELRGQAKESVGDAELQSAYDRVHDDYDEFWLSAAAGPIDELFARLDGQPVDSVFEAGCGTGYSTQRLSELAGGNVLAVDLSAGMLENARDRLRSADTANVEFRHGDALKELAASSPFDLVFSSWVLGYIPLTPFFKAAASALRPGGRLAFVVHQEDSPREPLEIFGELVAADPSVLTKRVAFDFPRDLQHIRDEMAAAGLSIEHLWEGGAAFEYPTADDVLEHLLKSGAGTAFYDAIDLSHRDELTAEFLARLAENHRDRETIPVMHDYVACIAIKP
jgi:MoaA/NifB/PqqE/SkfB family radical SAM enzyme/SAM-dependent methyltransferase